MKLILDTLKELKDLIDRFVTETIYKDTALALVGGYAVIAHGVERTTKDVDLIAVGSPYDRFGKDLADFLGKQFYAKNISVEYMPQGLAIDDPFQHEVVYIKDMQGAIPKIDILIARYKWELEGTISAEPEKEIPFNLLPKPYLIAMKLKAGGLKDDSDIIELYSLLTEEEKTKTHKLAKLIHRDKKLAYLLTPKAPEAETTDEDQLISPPVKFPKNKG